MTHQLKTIAGTPDKGPVIKAVLIGAGVGFLLTLFFITGADVQPHWPSHWKIRPLIITPLAGAIGGGMCYAAIKILKSKGVNKVAAIFISLIGLLIALWIGIILGLEGTLWD